MPRKKIFPDPMRDPPIMSPLASQVMGRKTPITGGDIDVLRDAFTGEGDSMISLSYGLGIIPSGLYSAIRNPEEPVDPLLGILVLYYMDRPNRLSEVLIPHGSPVALYDAFRNVDPEMTRQEFGFLLGRGIAHGARVLDEDSSGSTVMSRLCLALLKDVEEEGAGRVLTRLRYIAHHEAVSRGFKNGLDDIRRNRGWTMKMEGARRLYNFLRQADPRLTRNEMSRLIQRASGLSVSRYAGLSRLTRDRIAGYFADFLEKNEKTPEGLLGELREGTSQAPREIVSKKNEPLKKTKASSGS